MPASIFNGSAVKILKNILRFKDGTDLAAADAANLSGTSSNVQDQIDAVVADIAALPDPIVYKGTWNASTNTPTLANTDTGKTGFLYQVNVAGSVNFGAGSISFDVGDKVVNDGSAWQKWDMTDAVTSVNGATGAVTVNAINQLTGDITAGPASGSQSQAATLATVNSNVGSFGSATQTAAVTVNAKGLVTAASNTVIQITESQVTNLTIDLSNKQNKALGDGHIWVGNVSNVGADVAMSGAISIDHSGVTSYASTVPVNKGGTNSTSTLNNNRVMQSSGGAIIEASAITASRALISDSNGIPTHSAVTSTELGYVSGASSNLQTQITSNASNVATNTSNIATNTSNIATNTSNIATNTSSISTNTTAIAAQAANNARNLNWITNYGVETNTTGYATYADAAATTPVDGTGGSPTLTIARSTTTPLDGAASLRCVKDAANRQGEGFSYDFTIDKSYQGAQQQIAFNYEVVSGTYASGDMTVWLYDVTNSVLLSQPSGNSIISTSIPSQQGQCTFQAPINSTSLRLIFHVTTTSASAYTLAFDNVSVGPQIQASGGVDTAWASYTPTFTGFGSQTGVDFKWRREGPDLIIEGRATSGTMTATEARISLPTGATSASDYTTLQLVGKLNGASNSSTYFSANTVLIEPSVTYMTFGRESSTTNGVAKANGNALISDAVVFSLFARIRIAGWGPNTVLSTSANTRLVDFLAFKNAGSVTAATAIPTWTTVSKDSAAGFNSSTGIYTIAVPGDYFVSFTAAFTTSNADFLAILKNGSAIANGVDATTSIRNVSSLLTGLVVGDTISVTNSGSRTISSSAIQTSLSIFMLQGPQQIAASESINARYFASATSISGSLTTVVWTTMDYDTHNRMASGVYTCAAPGKYQVNSALAIAGTFALNNQTNMVIQKNNVTVSEILEYAGGIITADHVSVSDTISCVAGDTIRVQVSSGATTPTIVSSNTKNYISIERVGN